MRLLSVDPGKNACGVALWDETSKELLEARYIEASIAETHALLAVVPAVSVWLFEHEYPSHHIPMRVVCELPQVYQTAQQKGDQGDLIDLAVVVGGLVAALGCKATLRRPREWKGQLPKEVTTTKSQELLTDDERSRVLLPKSRRLHHNVWDAVAIGLGELGRAPWSKLVVGR